MHYETAKCIRCGKPAVIHTGHVVSSNGKKITAGWCGERCLETWKGYCGPYKAAMGKRLMAE